MAEDRGGEHGNLIKSLRMSSFGMITSRLDKIIKATLLESHPLPRDADDCTNRSTSKFHLTNPQREFIVDVIAWRTDIIGSSPNHKR